MSTNVRYGCLAVGAIALLILIPLTIWGGRVLTAEWRGRGEAHMRVQSADFRLAAYEHFFESCSGIQGLEGSLAALEAQYATTSDARTQNIVATNIAGVRSARQQAIADYNADARKNYTEGQFRDNDLPFYINPSEEARTTCGAN